MQQIECKEDDRMTGMRGAVLPGLKRRDVPRRRKMLSSTFLD
jgi:hypothetical protein